MQTRDRQLTERSSSRGANGAREIVAAPTGERPAGPPIERPSPVLPRREPGGPRVPAGVPEGPYRAILEARSEARLEELRAENERARAAARIGAEAEQRLAVAVGAEALTCWRRHVTDARREARRFQFQLSGADGYVEKEARLRARTRAEALGVQRELGIEMSKVREVHAWANAGLARLGKIDVTAASDMAQMLTRDDDLVIEALNGDLEREWLVFEPAYHTQDSYEEGWSNGLSVSVSSHVNSLVGQVGQRIRLHTSDASGFDAAAITELSTNAVIFITPKSGPIEVLVEAQALGTDHHLRLLDEFGWSEAHATQKNWLTMQTFTSEASLRREILTSHFKVADETDGTWDTRFVNLGDTSWFQFFSDRAFQEGEIIWMDLGSLSYNYAQTDDVEVTSTLDFTWFLRQVHVRPTGT